jgi:DNA-binding transcriptional MerR regulator
MSNLMLPKLDGKGRPVEQFNIKAVVKYSGINAHTLRAWERRYGVIKPARESNGRRMYSLAEAERLKILAELVSLGHAIGNLSRLSDSELRSLFRRLAHYPESSERSAQSVSEATAGRRPSGKPLKLVTTPEEISVSCQRVLDVLSNFELENLHSELLRAKAQHSVRSFVLDVALPLVGLVGDLVNAGKMSIAQEHALSSILRVQLGEIIYTLRRSESPVSSSAEFRPFSVVMATQDGDLHEFGILMSAVLCAANGVQCHYLGANLPAKPLAEAAAMLRADAVLVGRTSVMERRMKGSDQLDYLRSLHAAMPIQTEIWVGGGLECDLASVASADQSREVRYMRSLQELDRYLQGVTRSHHDA